MYDITSRHSFVNLTKWIEETTAYSNDKLTLILVGNKNDLSSKYLPCHLGGKSAPLRQPPLPRTTTCSSWNAQPRTTNSQVKYM